jgi:phosphate transport system substrate-binding protein
MSVFAAVRIFRRAAFVGAALIAALSATIGAGTPAAASGAATALIQGSGSTWAYNAVQQWITDVTPNGLQVVYSGEGSAQGRTDYANKTVDFAVSDIGYQGKDPVTGQSDTSLGRPYAYLPIVAGGTSFPYNLTVGGKRITNLRLSGETIAKIFTNQITNWDSPAIQQDNNLKKPLPSLPIIPVVHSEGSGDSAQFSRWLATDYASIWDPFGGKTFTEYWPRQGPQVAENGSDSVINYITSSAGNGSIGYDEYSYALAAGFPVLKVLNKAGYYTLPNQYNVAVALTKAEINYNKSSPNYLLENLNNVYVNPAPQTYPLSSYSYMIEPTSATDATMTTAKRQTLADYLYFSICQGQAQMGPIGYSPLPVNLVEAGFQQIAKLHTADPDVDLSKQNVTTCHNPTFVAGHPTENHLAQIAPQPLACDKEGAGPCSATQVNNPTGNPTKGAAPSSSANPQSSNGTGQHQSTGPQPTSSTGPGAISTPGVQGTAPTDPNGLTNPAAGSAGNVASVEADLPASPDHEAQVVLAILAGLLFLGAILLPPVVIHAVNRRKK